MATTLVIMRHAKPVSDGGYADDSLRPLSDEGRGSGHMMATYLKRHGIIPCDVYTSPFVRAQETGDLMEEVFGVEHNDVVALSGNSFFDESALLALIPSPSKNRTIFFIGHEPTLGRFVNKLVGRTVISSGLAKGGAVVLTFDQYVDVGMAEFVAYYTPEEIERGEL